MGTVVSKLSRKSKRCSVEGCKKWAFEKGLCKKHKDDPPVAAASNGAGGDRDGDGKGKPVAESEAEAKTGDTTPVVDAGVNANATPTIDAATPAVDAAEKANTVAPKPTPVDDKVDIKEVEEEDAPEPVHAEGDADLPAPGDADNIDGLRHGRYVWQTENGVTGVVRIDKQLMVISGFIKGLNLNMEGEEEAFKMLEFYLDGDTEEQTFELPLRDKPLDMFNKAARVGDGSATISSDLNFSMIFKDLSLEGKLEYKDEFFRTLALDIDAEDKQFLEDVLWDRLEEDCSKAGLKLVIDKDNHDIIESPEGGKWTNPLLKGIMDTCYQRPVDSEIDMSFHVALLGIHKKGEGFLGFMYDWGIYNTNDTQREGLAIYCKALQAYKAAPYRHHLTWTIMHELGHAMNIMHSFDMRRPPKWGGAKYDVLSFMNYAVKYQNPNKEPKGIAGRLDTPGYWKAYAEKKVKYENRDLVHIRHSPHFYVAASGVKNKRVDANFHEFAAEANTRKNMRGNPE